MAILSLVSERFYLHKVMAILLLVCAYRIHIGYFVG